MGRLLASARLRTGLPANFNTAIVPVKIKIKISVELYWMIFGFQSNLMDLPANFNTASVPVKIKIGYKVIPYVN